MPSRSRKSSSATVCCADRAPAHRRRARRCGPAGFTLLEAIIALAVLGIGLGVIFQGLAQGLRVRRESAENVRLAIVGERFLGELLAREGAPSEAEEGEEAGVRWRVETVPAAAAAGEGSPFARLMEVRLILESRAGRRWVLTTLLPEARNPGP
jgi:general secretion pathway protein I